MSAMLDMSEPLNLSISGHAQPETDTRDEYVSEEVAVEFEFIVHGLLLTSVGIAGLFANIICLIILCQPSLRRGQGSVNVILVRIVICLMC